MAKKQKEVKVKIPLWVLKELIKEKKGWVEENRSRGELPNPFEEWITDNLPNQLKKEVD